MIIDNAYYFYNQKAYQTREQAFDDMLMNRDYGGKLEFHFHESAFRSIDWLIEPNVNLETLYKLRAQQLRDKYNYLILAFSGGSDSTQILQTCLKNNIFIDEIQITHHKSLIAKLDKFSMFKDNELSQFLEYEYAVEPMLKRVRELSPNTKITSLDAGEFTYDQYVNQKFKHINSDDDVPNNTQKLYSFMPKTTLYYLNYYNMRIKNPPPNSCLIRGFEKPVVLVTDHQEFEFMFNDMILHSFHKKIFDNFVIENFYWSKDAPLIPIKQSHVIKSTLEKNLKLFKIFDLCIQKIRNHTDSKSYSPAIMIERVFSKIIYPDWDPKTYATMKAINKPPEFKLLEHLGVDHYTNEFLRELGQEKENKFALLQNKRQFRDILYTKPYFIGRFEPKWKRS